MRRVFYTVIALLTIHHHASAHDMRIQWKLEGGTINVKVFFEGDLPVEAAIVTVLDANKKVLTSGKTDGYGKWKFPVPVSGRYKLVAADNEGHRAQEELTIVPTPANQATSGGRSPDESFPLAKIIIGFGIIGGMTVAAMIAYRVNRHKSSPPGNVNVNNSPSA